MSARTTTGVVVAWLVVDRNVGGVRMKRLAIACCAALGTVGTLAAAAAAMGTARAGGAKSSIFTERDLVVTLATPTVNQEVLADLSDPGLNYVITVRFSSLLNPRDVIDTQNVVNQLSS